MFMIYHKLTHNNLTVSIVEHVLVVPEDRTVNNKTEYTITPPIAKLCVIVTETIKIARDYTHTVSIA